jgi:indolepyruvate ferredoxin oxidoreductase alpha subunit
MKVLLSGNEAIARGAYEFGVTVVAGYPGTPSTEVVEHATKFGEIYCEWSANEKVALDVAIGAAYAGRRAMAVMKMSGLNVAADSLFYAPYTGLNGGGLVIVVADDPGQFSSQTEQDSRRYAPFAKLPMVEPSDSQEARDLVGDALALSQEWDIPVLLRTVMRVSHCSSVVELGEREWDDSIPASPFRHDPSKLVCTSPRSRVRHPIVERKLQNLKELSSQFGGNQVEWGNRNLGIVSSGPAYRYAREIFPDASFLKLALTFPLPEALVAEFAAGVDRLIVIEELEPFLEEQIRLLGIGCEGQYVFPRWGELTPGVIKHYAVEAGLLSKSLETTRSHFVPDDLPVRSPTFCPGCPHRSTFYALSKIRDLVVAGDIGCYNLASLPPFDLVDTAGAMGSSVGVAHGFDVAGLPDKRVALVGDSTLFHSGIAPILSMIHNGGDTTTIILDNQTTAMTGHQDHPGVGVRIDGKSAPRIDIEQMVRGWEGIHVSKVNAFDVEAVECAIKEALAVEGPSLVIAEGPCFFVEAPAGGSLQVDNELCIACGRCLRLGCPAILPSDEKNARTGKPKAKIDPILCVGCEMCAQLCSEQAILIPMRVE